MHRKPLRYRVTPTLTGCQLWIAGDYSPSGDPEVRTYWAPESPGYAYDTTHAPGTAGQQVGATLFGMGATLACSRAALPDAIRALARAHCDATDREMGR